MRNDLRISNDDSDPTTIKRNNNILLPLLEFFEKDIYTLLHCLCLCVVTYLLRPIASLLMSMNAPNSIVISMLRNKHILHSLSLSRHNIQCNFKLYAILLVFWHWKMNKRFFPAYNNIQKIANELLTTTEAGHKSRPYQSLFYIFGFGL